MRVAKPAVSIIAPPANTLTEPMLPLIKGLLLISEPPTTIRVPLRLTLLLGLVARQAILRVLRVPPAKLTMPVPELAERLPAKLIVSLVSVPLLVKVRVAVAAGAPRHITATSPPGTDKLPPSISNNALPAQPGVPPEPAPRTTGVVPGEG